ncbi:hypothetical protein [Mesorhizobium sp. B2-6-2]|uniref:hypothetical protein n=1 Tax=Mesorhizobium sp. B2-6-2 TaxID=2589915 RepID=UPI00112CB6F2|nr:hypothetical protein [Mesorhizobium sp. B2-6-2]TPJ77139.1 hypothetical protein FJ419_16565 [Mesorhizobium sp. B2-6-2]
MKREPILTKSVFIKTHDKIDEVIAKKLLTPLGEELLNIDLRDALLEREAKCLYAINKRSRIAFAKSVYRTFKRIINNKGKKATYHFVTLAPARFAVPISQASAMDVARIIKWTRRHLGKCHFVACVEAAIYPNLAKAGIAREIVVSWHVHAIVWGVKREAVKERVDRVTKRCPSLLPGVPAGHVATFTADEILGRVWYALKAPCSEHNVYPMKTEDVNGETGEIFTVATGRFRQKKREIRPGNAVRMVGIMGTRTIPDLAFGGVKGAAFLERAEKAARRTLEKQDREAALRLDRLFE